MKVSKHITIHEATVSQTATRKGISNIPNDEVLLAMQLVAGKCFEKIRAWYKKPIKINSFYRSKELNEAIGGSQTSQHVKGEAIDLSGGSRVENKKIFEWCKNNLIFDQLIYEYGDETGPDWVHVSYTGKGVNRQQVLTIK